MCFCCFQLKEMTEQKVGLETQVDKIAREKISILAELEQTKKQIDTFDSDYNRVSSQDILKLFMSILSKIGLNYLCYISLTNEILLGEMLILGPEQLTFDSDYNRVSSQDILKLFMSILSKIGLNYLCYISLTNEILLGEMLILGPEQLSFEKSFGHMIYVQVIFKVSWTQKALFKGKLRHE